MIQPSEVITLIYGLVALAAILWLARSLVLPGKGWLIAGVAITCAAYVFTVVEGLLWHEFFDLLEHYGYAAAGISFALGLLVLSRSTRGEDPTT